MRLLFLLGLICWGAVARADVDPRQFRKATELFNRGDYAAALPLYRALHAADPEHPAVNYGLGVCLRQAADYATRAEAIEPLQTATRVADATVPPYVYYHLGRAYHEAGRYAEGEAQFVSLLKKIGKQDNYYAHAQRYLQNCQVGKETTPVAADAVVMNLGTEINSEVTEYAPLVAASEEELIYTRLRKAEDTRNAVRTASEQVMTSAYASGWQAPSPAPFASLRTQAGSVWLSPDGQELLVYLKNGNQQGDIFRCERRGDEWVGPLELGPRLNTRYRETFACFANNRTEVYFASDRPGGFGGLDLYRMRRKRDGGWAYPENLGPNINTGGDEDAPFVHPNGQTLYFHSDGPRSMGGLDLMKSDRRGDQWAEAVNLGEPFNTPFNDGYFNVTPDGSKGYFSSDRPGGQGQMDIYLAGLPLEMNLIPLTMLKGRVLSGQDRQPVPARISVLEHATGEPVPGVYHPNAAGRYLIIFPPGKDYDLIVQADGFKPQIVKTSVPKQSYFHEIYQQIILEPIKQFDERVGQRVVVENAFYDTEQNDVAALDARKAYEMQLVRDSLDVFAMMDMVIASGDSVAYDYLLELMYDTNPIENVDFDNPPLTSAERSEHFYDEEMVSVEVGGQTIYTVASAKPAGARSVTGHVQHPPVRVYFDVNQAKLKADYHAQLDDIIAAWRQQPGLRLEIAGYADASGDYETNLRLSNERAKSVSRYCTEQGVPYRQIVAQGHGQTSKASYRSDTDKQQDRRVVVRLITEVDYRALIEQE